jgi:hypothetical protein
MFSFFFPQGGGGGYFQCIVVTLFNGMLYAYYQTISEYETVKKHLAAGGF